MALLLEQQLLVASDTLSKVGGNLIGLVEGSHHNALHTTQSSTHGLCLAAEHVHITVKDGLVVSGGDGTHVHLGTLLATGILAYNLSPEHACSTYLGYLHEVHSVDTQIELDVLCCQFGRYTSLGEGCQILVTPCQCITQVLITVGTGIGQSVSIHGHSTELGIVGQKLYQLFG